MNDPATQIWIAYAIIPAAILGGCIIFGAYIARPDEPSKEGAVESVRLVCGIDGCDKPCAQHSTTRCNDHADIRVPAEKNY